MILLLIYYIRQCSSDQSLTVEFIGIKNYTTKGISSLLCTVTATVNWNKKETGTGTSTRPKFQEKYKN